MQVYEIVLDGKLSADIMDVHGPLSRRDVGNVTVLRVSATDGEALARALTLLQDLGFGMLALQVVDLPVTAAASPAAR